MYRGLHNEKPRVVSDISRFEYEKHAPRQRSRNTTPNSLGGLPDVPTPEQYYDYYASLNPQRSIRLDHPIVSPYPRSMGEGEDHLEPPLHPTALAFQFDLPRTPSPVQQSLPPPVPPKDSKDYVRAQYDADSLPPVEDVRDYARGIHPHQPPISHAKNNLCLSDGSEVYLVGQVMHRPLIRFRPRVSEKYPNDSRIHRFYLTTSNLLDIIQACFSIVIITFASILSSTDKDIDINIYRYLIAVGVILLIVSVLFLTRTVKFDKRKGIFYCLVSCLLSVIGLIIALSTFAVDYTCHHADICRSRKVLAAFTVLSAILSLCLLIMYFTALFISKKVSEQRQQLLG